MRKSLTYKTLENVLRRLGFQEEHGIGHTVFTNTDHDAIIVLPTVSPLAQVKPFHLISVRETTIRKGVANSDNFDHALYSSDKALRAPDQITTHDAKRPKYELLSGRKAKKRMVFKVGRPDSILNNVDIQK